MALAKLTPLGDSAFLTISKQILEQLGLDSNDEIDVTVVDKTLMVRSISEAEREKRLNRVIDEVLEKRDRVLLH